MMLLRVYRNRLMFAELTGITAIGPLGFMTGIHRIFSESIWQASTQKSLVSININVVSGIN